MKRKRLTEAQIVFALRQADSGVPVAEVIRRATVLPRRRHPSLVF